MLPPWVLVQPTCAGACVVLPAHMVYGDTRMTDGLASHKRNRHGGSCMFQEICRPRHSMIYRWGEDLSRRLRRGQYVSVPDKAGGLLGSVHPRPRGKPWTCGLRYIRTGIWWPGDSDMLLTGHTS